MTLHNNKSGAPPRGVRARGRFFRTAAKIGIGALVATGAVAAIAPSAAFAQAEGVPEASDIVVSQPPAAAPESATGQAPAADVSSTQYFSAEVRFNSQVTPHVYGDVMSGIARIETDGPVFLTGQPIQILIDEEPPVTTVILPATPGKYWAFIQSTRLDAGTHTVTMHLPETTDQYTSNTVRAATSEPWTFTIAQAPTTSAITSAPATVEAFMPATVTAQFSSAVPGLSGTAGLYAGDELLATEVLPADGAVTFTVPQLPAGNPELIAKFEGDDAGNYAQSTSQGHVVTVTDAATSTELTLSADEALADEQVGLDIVFTNTSGVSTVDPAGAVEILVDGDVVQTLPISADADVADGETFVSGQLSGLALGEQTVQARLAPAAGFAASVSAGAALTVHGIESTVTPLELEVRGTTEAPAHVDVVVERVQSGAAAAHVAAPRVADPVAAAPANPVEGYVQAYLGAEPVGDLVALEAGAARVTLAGLAEGAHEVDVRFTPAEQGWLTSSATVTAVIAGVAPAPAPAPAPKPAVKPAPVLANTGGDGGLVVMLGVAGAVVLIAGAALVIAGRRKKRQD